MNNTKIKTVKHDAFELNKLIPYDDNIKVHTPKQITHIAESFKKFGIQQPIVADENSIILAGHGRYLAAKQIALKTVPVWIVEGYTDDEKEAFRIVDNETNAETGYDKEKMQITLDKILKSSVDYSAMGLDEKFYNKFFKPTIKEDDFKENFDQKIYIKQGDIIKLGRHTIVCGDSTDKKNWTPTDVCFTSPPYNRGDSVKLANTNFANTSYVSTDDNKKLGEYKSFLTKITNNAIQSCKVTAINIQILAGNKNDLISWLADYNSKFIDVLIWNKTNPAPAMAKNVLNSAFEFVFLFSSNDYPSRAIETADFHGDKSNVISTTSQGNNEYSDIHAATMPITFAAHMIQLLGGQSVTDCFLGTGTTLIACEQLNRLCHGIDFEPLYCQVTIDRYKQYCNENDIPFVCTINGTDINQINK